MTDERAHQLFVQFAIGGIIGLLFLIARRLRDIVELLEAAG